jgi:hypothetical protein
MLLRPCEHAAGSSRRVQDPLPEMHIHASLLSRQTRSGVPAQWMIAGARLASMAAVTILFQLRAALSACPSRQVSHIERRCAYAYWRVNPSALIFANSGIAHETSQHRALSSPHSVEQVVIVGNDRSKPRARV